MIQALKNVIDSNLCTGCGTCVGICPNEILAMQITKRGIEVPRAVKDNCKDCNLCTSVCPVINENHRQLNQFVFNKASYDRFIGTFCNCYTGYSTNARIRWEATSGGLITSLLIFLLETKQIDKALLIRTSQEDPLKGESFIAQTRTDIMSAMGTKYVPVSLNKLIRKILAEEGKFAIVGLPCHIQAIRRAELKVSALRDKISYHLGLTCSHTMNYHGIGYVLGKMGIPRDSIMKLDYRGRGWPSGIRVLLRDGRERFVPNQNSLWSEIFGGYFFTPYCCTMCFDHLNEFSDISFADAWLPEILKNDTKGTSIAITRTKLGEDLIKSSVSEGRIEISELDRDSVVRAQLWPLFFKKRNIRARSRLLETFGKMVPEDLRENRTFFLSPTLYDYIIAPVPYISTFISGNKFLMWIFKRVPLRILSSYRALFKRLLLANSEKAIGEKEDGR